MLHTVLIFTASLFISYGQQCKYNRTHLYDKGKSSNGASKFGRTGEYQYVVYDFAVLGNNIRGEYFLPFIFTDEDKNTKCHSEEFSVLTSIAFECSTGYEDGSETADTIVYARSYNSGDCTGDVAKTVWWERGYSPFMDESGQVVSDCDTTEMCLEMNYTRSAVTEYTGNRFDFSCEGEVEYTEATLCAGSTDCGGNLCSSVSAAIGAGCIGTPNSTFANLLASCTNKNAYLTTFIDFAAYGAAQQYNLPWNTYTLNRTCSNNNKTGYTCNVITVGKECGLAFDTTIGGNAVDIYGKMTECTDSFKSKGLSLNYSIMLLFISAFIAFMQY